jgi:putative transcriptional regulator
MVSKYPDLNRIEIVLTELKVSQKNLAEGIGKGSVMVNRYCTNKAQPPLATLFKIADFLKVDVRRLLVPNRFAKGE